MKVTRLVSAPFEVNVYVAAADGHALVVDASSGLDWPAFGGTVAASLAGLQVDAFHLTHLHVDHVGGAARVAKLAGTTPTIHADEADAVEHGDATLTGGRLFGAPQEACPVTRVKEGEVVAMGPHRFEVILVPGHSPAHTALWDPETRSLFSGDVVFEGGSFGRVDLPGAEPRALLTSLEKLAALDPVDMYPGHMRPVLGGAREAIMHSLDNARSMIG